jgi:RND superfamily putative drug exporter
MTLLGRHAWWTPRRLDKVMPHIDTEGEGEGEEGRATVKTAVSG